MNAKICFYLYIFTFLYVIRCENHSIWGCCVYFTFGSASDLISPVFIVVHKYYRAFPIHLVK